MSGKIPEAIVNKANSMNIFLSVDQAIETT
jgi:hypothetical protein